MAKPPRLLTFVVSYDEKETGATVNKLIKVASKSSVFERAKDAFGLHGVCVYEYFNADYQTNIRVDSPDDLPDGGRVKIIPAATTALDGPRSISSASTEPAVESLIPSLASTSPIFVVEESASSLLDSSSTAVWSDSELSPRVFLSGGSSVAVTVPEKRKPSELNTPGRDCTPQQPDERPAENREKRKPSELNTPGGDCTPQQPGKRPGENRRFFCYQALTRGLRMKMEEGLAALRTADWGELTDSVYARYTMAMKSDRPSKAEYQQIVCEILDANPCLRGNLSLSAAMDLIKRHVRDKFRNKRAAQKRSAACLDCEQPSTEPTNSKRASGPAAKRRRVAGLPHYSPGVAAGGEVAMQRKLNELRHAEAEDKERLMNETFPARRDAIIKGTPLEQILADYPGLFDDGGFHREVDRMAGMTDFIPTKVLEAGKLVEDVKRCLNCSDTVETVCQMGRLMGADLPNALAEAASGGPRLTPSGDIEVDGKLLVKPKGYIEAILCLVASYSVLNISFPRKSSAFLTYVQLYWLGVDDGCRVPAKTMAFRQQIAAMLQD